MDDRRNAKAMTTSHPAEVFFPNESSLVIVGGCLQFRRMPPARVDPLFVQRRSAGGKALVAGSPMGFGSLGTDPFDFSAPGICTENGTGLSLLRRGIEEDTVSPNRGAAMSAFL